MTKLRNWMDNAKRLGRDDIYRAPLQQLCRVEGRNIDDPIEADFATLMRALEEALTAEAGRTKRLNRTRQKLNRVGVRKTLAELALKPQPSDIFSGMLAAIDEEIKALKWKLGHGQVDGLISTLDRIVADMDHLHQSGDLSAARLYNLGQLVLTCIRSNRNTIVRRDRYRSGR